MEISQAPFFIFLLFSFVHPKFSSPTLTCGNNTFFVQYPFHLQQENHKPHPNPFILQCNIQGITVLRLPFSGEFYVRNIDYFGQKIQLYDPASILATSLVSRAEEIKNLTGCSVTIISQIPVSKIDQFEYDGFNGDLHLGWSVPQCDEDCKAKTRSRAVLSIIIVSLVTVSIFVLSVLFCLGCCLRLAGIITEIDEANYQTPRISVDGAPEMSRIAFPPGQLWSHSSATRVETTQQHEFSDGFFTEELIIGGRQCISGPNGDSCPICLEEYQPSGRLRRICKCDHCFHAHCLETWLEKETTCPVCRINVVS